MIFQMRKLRYKTVKSPAQSHTTTNLALAELKLDNLAPEENSLLL